MSDLLVDGELLLYGTVGDDLWGEGFTARQVVTALAEVGRSNDVVVRINSPGGYASEGAAIYNALAAHKGHKTVYVDGSAMSAASLIAMAGNQINMRKGSVMMIHDPASITVGDAATHEKSIEALNALGDSFAEIYAERSGLSIEDARADMRAELWLTPQAAIERGYATASIDAEAVPPVMFNYGLYQHVPPAIMAAANTSKPPRAARKPAHAAVHQSQTETPMANEPAAQPAALSEFDVQRRVDEALTAHNARTEAILGCDEAKGRDDLAKFLAFGTKLDVDAAKSALAKAPKPAEAVVNPFERAMASAGNPVIGPDAPEQIAEADEATAMAKQAVTLFRGQSKGNA